jgi:hypothetical protein
MLQTRASKWPRRRPESRSLRFILAFRFQAVISPRQCWASPSRRRVAALSWARSCRRTLFRARCPMPRRRSRAAARKRTCLLARPISRRLVQTVGRSLGLLAWLRPCTLAHVSAAVDLQVGMSLRRRRLRIHATHPGHARVAATHAPSCPKGWSQGRFGFCETSGEGPCGSAFHFADMPVSEKLDLAKACGFGWPCL